MIEQLNREAREAGFLIFGDYDDPDLYMRQMKPDAAIFIERLSRGRYLCYRINWHKPTNGHHRHRFESEKIYCRGNLRRCLNKAKSVIDFWINGPKKKKKKVVGK